MGLLLAFVVSSRLDVLASFSRVSSVLCFGVHVVSTRCSGKLCWLTLRDVIGEALLSSEVVEFVILWCYGFGTVLDFFGWFRCESPAGRLPGQPCARWSAQLRVQEHKRVARERRERARALARRFKLSGFGPRPQAAGPIRASVRDGAPPARLLLQGIFM